MIKVSFSRIGFVLFVWLFLLQSCSKDIDSQIRQPIVEADKTSLEKILDETKWETEQVTAGIIWKYFHFNELFGGEQSVTIFEIDSRLVKLGIEYITSGFLKTSVAGERAGAAIAFNGSFFDTSSGGSTVFFKSDGNVINETRSGFTLYRENAAFGIHGDNVGIYKKPGINWSGVQDPTVLAGGPLLVYDHHKVEQLYLAFNTDRHPRTAIGVTDAGNIIAVVIDGRFRQSIGVSISDLSSLMAALGCKVAMNMDGGGSSTAWVKGKGVVNFPSDNGLFDHNGERGVATVITVAKK